VIIDGVHILVLSNSSQIAKIKRQIVRKSNDLITARHRLSVAEQRVVLLLATTVSSSDEEFKDYELKVSDFAQIFGLDACKAIYTEVEHACETLVTKKIELSTSDRKIFAAWLSYAEYIAGSGVVKIRFDKVLKPYLLQLRGHFTQYPLSHVANFKSQYSLKLYDLLKMNSFKAKDDQIIFLFDYQELRKVLAIEKNEYKLFGHFKSRVIMPAVEEITKYTDLKINKVDYGKTGRKITNISFNVNIKSPDETTTNKIIQHKNQSSHHVINSLVNLGFSAEVARKLKNKYGVKRLERNIAYTLAKKDAGVVKDLPSYLYSSIENDLGNSWNTTETYTSNKSKEISTDHEKHEALSQFIGYQQRAKLLNEPIENLITKKELAQFRKFEFMK
jgi:plasmid replication initiation protein